MSSFFMMQLLTAFATCVQYRSQHDTRNYIQLLVSQDGQSTSSSSFLNWEHCPRDFEVTYSLNLPLYRMPYGLALQGSAATKLPLYKPLDLCRHRPSSNCFCFRGIHVTFQLRSSLEALGILSNSLSYYATGHPIVRH